MDRSAESKVISPASDCMRARGSGEGSTIFGLAVFVLGLLLVIVAGLVAFPHVASGIFFSWASATYVVNAKEYLENGTITGLIASYTQSFGNMAYPVNFNLIPEARLAYIEGKIDPTLMYVLASSLFFVTTYALGSMLGFGALAKDI